MRSSTVTTRRGDGQTWQIRARRCLLLLAGAGIPLLSGCGAGAYPVDLFQEMHYQPSQRRQEPDRLAPPPGAVPITGASQPYTFAGASDLRNPVARAQALAQGREVYSVNCAVCHGKEGRADSFVAKRLGESAVKPVNLTEARARDRTDGQLYWLLTNGIGNMPPFATLLTDNDRWALVHVIRDIQGQ